MNSRFLFEDLNDNINVQTEYAKKYKDYIDTYINPNMKHTLRPYQEDALVNLMYLQDKPANIVATHYRQLMFNMATGSGKTDLMVAIMLYMYQAHGYQDFIYTIGSNDVLEKTKDNFTNPNSNKYLFSNNISMNGHTISIKAVSNFPVHPNPHVIYICMYSIEELDSDLNNPKENAITRYELQRQKLVILADEAHHYNVTTKQKAKKNLSGSWEVVLDTIRNLRLENRQFEFTATINTRNKTIRMKYLRKIVYKYDLDKFMFQRYSKQVYWARAQINDKDKMLLAILMSEYRFRLAHKIGIANFKPIILFKSTKIKESKHNNNLFIDLINKLDSHYLRKFINKELNIIDPTKDKMLQIVFNYWSKQNLVIAIHDLKIDFDKKTIINANSKNEIANYKYLNDLDNPNNPFRVIFEVDKLNEGWDVLNLYDIVRLGKGSVSKNKTDSEAQLVGRGARYYPFNYPKRKGNKYKRCFDDKGLKYQLLESLFYYTFNDHTYVKNLRKSFDDLKLLVYSSNDSRILSTRVKRAFLHNDVYKHGKLYANLTKDFNKNNIHSLTDVGIDINAINKVNISNSLVETTLENADNNIEPNQKLIRIIPNYLGDDPKLVKKAMAKTKDKYHFYRFDGLSKYLPIKSLHEFRCDKRWLGKIRLDAIVNANVIKLDTQDKLRAIQLFLEQIRNTIIRNSNKSKGTDIFYPIPVSKVVHDYQKQVPNNYANKNISNIKMVHIRKHPMPKDSWFVYNDAIVDGLEWNCINMIKNMIPNIKTKYDNIYLIRNDEKSDNKISLHDFRKKANHFDAYLPDFVLYMNTKQHNIINEFYLEPKGTQLFNNNEDQNLNHNDIWKENLLNFIRPKNIKIKSSRSSKKYILGENSHVKLYGLRFFVHGDARNTEKQLYSILNINKNSKLFRPKKLK